MKRTGVSTGSIELSPRKRKARRRAREKQERQWAERSGPVVVRWVEPKPASKKIEDGRGRTDP